MAKKLLILIFLLGACGTENKELVLDFGNSDQGKEADMGFVDSTKDLEDSAQDLVEDSTVSQVDPCTDLSWSTSDAGTFSPRDHHATFITTRGGPRLHVVGGTNYQTIFSDHWIADIGMDGNLGPWRAGEPLPEPRAGQSVIVQDDQVWLISGRTLRTFETTTFRAKWEDEKIVGWIEDAPVPEGRFHSSGVATDGTVWVTGGIGATGAAQPTIFRGTLGEGGEVLSWETLTLPEPRSHHGAFAKDGDIYLAFGFSGSPVGNQTVPHFDIVKFPSSTALAIEPEAFFTGTNEYVTISATVTDTCVRTFGGVIAKNGAPEYLSTVLRFDFGDAIAVADTKFIQGRSHMHQAPYYNGAFYLAGGSIGLQVVTDTVEIGRVAR